MLLVFFNPKLAFDRKNEASNDCLRICIDVIVQVRLIKLMIYLGE
jgi:hypothetical protein